MPSIQAIDDPDVYPVVTRTIFPDDGLVTKTNMRCQDASPTMPQNMDVTIMMLYVALRFDLKHDAKPLHFIVKRLNSSLKVQMNVHLSEMKCQR